MKIHSIRLAGFKGIKRGMGKDEFKIDFSAMPNGILAIVGPNGAGKSTILDNLHPYRIMPSRPGSYYDNCEGLAEKELVFEIDGTEYQSLIRIDCIRKKQEAYLYYRHTVEGKLTQLIAISDGKAETYDKAIEDIVGSEQIFFSSAFRSQNAKPLSAYTKSELKEIFEQLLLLDSIKVKGDIAKEYNKQFLEKQTKLSVRKGELQLIVRDKELLVNKESECLLKIERGKKAITEYEASVQSMDDEIRTLERKEIEQAATIKELERLTSDRNTQQDCVERIGKEIKAEKIKYDGKIFEKEKALATAAIIIENADDINRKVQEGDVVAAEIKSMQALLEATQLKKDTYIVTLEKLQEARLKKSAIESELMRIKVKRVRAEQGVESLNRAPCNKNPEMLATCPFIQQAREDSNELIELRNREKLEEELLRCVLPTDDLEIKTKERDILTVETKDLSSQLKFLVEKHKNLLKYKDLLPQIETAKEQSGNLFKEIAELKSEQAAIQALKAQEINEHKHTMELLERDIAILSLNISTTVTSRIKELKTQMEQMVVVLKGARQGFESYYTDIGAIRESLRKISEAEEGIVVCENETRSVEKEISEWAIVAKALSREGVIALEIDDAGPAISGMANDLLSACFGPRFSVKLETTRPKKDGSGTMEVFDIKVIDTEMGEEKSIVDLSGGEKVWIEEAITRAIALYHQQQSGKTIKTLFTDEKDGALDNLRKKEYLKMKKRVLHLGGYEREIFITHAPELQELADGRVTIG